MATISEQLVQAVLTKCEGAKAAKETVNRERWTPVTGTEVPMISVYPINEEPAADQPRTRPVLERVLTVSVRIRVKGTSQDADPIRARIHAAIMSDRSLDKLALGIADTRTTWDKDEGADGVLVVVTTDYDIRFTTKAADLEAKQ